MEEPNELNKIPEPTLCTTSGSYINTSLTGVEETTDHDPTTKTTGDSTYTPLAKHADPSVYETLETKAQDKDQPETSADGVLAIMNKKQLQIFFSVLLVLIIILVTTLCILVPVLVSRILSKESRLDAVEALFQTKRGTVDDLEARITVLESDLSAIKENSFHKEQRFKRDKTIQRYVAQ